MNPADSQNTQLLDVLHRRGIATARELGETLGLSQPSVSRALTAAGPRVARIGRARRTRYAAVRDVRGLGGQWPLYRIDRHGRPHEFGQLSALWGDACLVVPASAPAWLRNDFAEGLFPGLPWFLDDMRPQGFLGRQFAHRVAPGLGFPDDLQRWNSDMVLAALLLHGDDGPGNFVVGDMALAHALGNDPDSIPADARELRYALLAEAAMAGELAGSSAAGEQPKFSASVLETSGALRHVLVKFSEPLAGNPTARRWADLLIAEHLASALLTREGHPAASTRLIRSQGRLCLESTRFDRVDAHGRRGLVTLAAWSDAHDGKRDDWPAAAERMHAAGWLDQGDLEIIRERWWFGRLIGNTDMHFGNLSFFLDDSLPLTLAPSYDMLPMLYRPTAGGALTNPKLDPPAPLPAEFATWRKAAAWAERYWLQAAGHPDLSQDFRGIANANHLRVIGLRQRFDGAHG